MNASAKLVFQPIANPQAVDLTRHALVEASAGTGKTYTIEHLVVRLLTEEPDLQLENILLVTFTEKATGELKARIRQKIEDALAGDERLEPATRKKLNDALDGFDNAAITTIHGFCHTLLNEYAFETGNLFAQEMVDDGPLMERLLLAQMRTDWPQRYGNRLERLLELASFSAAPQRFMDRVLSLARRLNLDGGHDIVIPDPKGLDGEKLWQSCEQSLLQLKETAGDPEALVENYGRLNFNARSKKAIVRDMVQPLADLLKAMKADNLPLAACRSLVAFLKKSYKEGRHIDRLVPTKWTKPGNNLDEACPQLPAMVALLEQLITGLGHLEHLLVLESVGQLQTDIRAAKEAQGWISYQDMIGRVAAFIDRAAGAEHLFRLRRRYQVAFVDEFQDTDELQWRIFRQLFLASQVDEKPTRLFLIGDPKQAIYGFRGADVYTYLEARQHLTMLAGQNRANLYALTTNWRSRPALIEAFNQMFIQPDWFGPADNRARFSIGYTPSDVPLPDQKSDQEVKSEKDGGATPVLTVMDLEAASSPAAAKVLLADFISTEIGDLASAGLDYGQMAILVRGRSEFALIEPGLLAAGIPYAYYRKPGLFTCPQAHWLSMVLHAVLQPQRQQDTSLALLTPFFDWTAEHLETLDELPANHICQRLLMRWHHLGRKRDWGALFQSILEDSGFMLRHCRDADWERSLTNLRQLFDHLESAAYLHNFDLDQMLLLLDRLRMGESGQGEEADIHQIEGEGGKVQVLTMHVSKGLEFPVVFVAGGLTVPANSGLQPYHRINNAEDPPTCSKVFDLTGETGRDQIDREMADENRRLYYVALTRAREKLYVPYFPVASRHRWVGPICRFVTPSLKAAFGQRAETDATLRWQAVVPTVGQAGQKSRGENRFQDAADQPSQGRMLASQIDFRGRRMGLESFSSLAHRKERRGHAAAEPQRFSLVESTLREDDEPEKMDAAPVPAVELADELPGGARMGSMFHHIFETIDFQAVLDGPEDILESAPLRQTVRRAMELFRIDSTWTGPVAAKVAATLRMPMKLHGRQLRLGELTCGQRRHEMEFFFPLTGACDDEMVVPGWSAGRDVCGQMVLRGFVDLIFCWQGRYYIADWKSNRLAGGYGQSSMAAEVAAAGYELQYRLYTIATLRWLKLCMKERFDPQRHFGGALYLFIRGADESGQTGVFHVPPESLLPQQSLEASMEEEIRGLTW